MLYSPDVWASIDVATTPDTRVGRRGSKLAVCKFWYVLLRYSMDLNESTAPLKLASERLNIPIHTIPPEKSTFRHWQLPWPFTPSEAPPSSHLLVTASFGRILSNGHLNAFAPGRKLNVHPSLVPAYRGAAPIQHVLIDGQKETGVSVIEMTERKKGLDSGGVWGTTHYVSRTPRTLQISVLN